MPTMTLKPTNGTEALTSPGAEQVHVELFTEALSVTTNTRKRKERTTTRPIVYATKINSKRMRFEERVEELKAYKAEHVHFKVKKNENERLHEFCLAIRVARKTPDKSTIKLTADRIAQLDAMGLFGLGTLNRQQQQ